MPVICISVAGLANENMQGVVDLAAALGADLETPELIQARTDFDAAVTAFSDAVAAKADLTSLFGTVGEDDMWHVAYAPDWADLAWYQSLGLTIVEPGVDPGAFWEQLSREEALKYTSDVFFQSTRMGRLTADQLQADPVFGVHPAIAAGQIGSWNQDFILSYQGLKAALDGMTSTLATAEKVTE